MSFTKFRTNIVFDAVAFLGIVGFILTQIVNGQYQSPNSKIEETNSLMKLRKPNQQNFRSMWWAFSNSEWVIRYLFRVYNDDQTFRQNLGN